MILVFNKKMFLLITNEILYIIMQLVYDNYNDIKIDLIIINFQRPKNNFNLTKSIIKISKTFDPLKLFL